MLPNDIVPNTVYIHLYIRISRENVITYNNICTYIHTYSRTTNASHARAHTYTLIIFYTSNTDFIFFLSMYRTKITKNELSGYQTPRDLLICLYLFFLALYIHANVYIALCILI